MKIDSSRHTETLSKKEVSGDREREEKKWKEEEGGGEGKRKVQISTNRISALSLLSYIQPEGHSK